MVFRSFQARVVLLFAAFLLQVATVVRADPSVIASDSLRVTVPLSGTWEKCINATCEDVTVPITVDYTDGPSVWTRQFDLSLTQAPAVAYLLFEGVTNRGEVRLNGQVVGSLSAYMEEKIDVASALIPNGQNELVVTLEDRLDRFTVPGAYVDQLVPVHGNNAYRAATPWAPKPGIIRDVELVHSAHNVIDQVFIRPVLTPDYSSADVNIRVRLANPTAPVVAGFAAVPTDSGILSTTLVPNASGELEGTITLASPNLWAPDTPELYAMSVGLWDGAQVTDAVLETFGVRRIERVGNRILLNGTPVFLKGMARHDIYTGGTYVVDPVQMETDLQQIRALGVNYLRNVHYPPDDQLMRRADEIGLLTSVEIPAWADFSNPDIIAEARKMLRLMVERDYNRPSVAFWFTGTAVEGNQADNFFPVAAIDVRAMDPDRLVSMVYDDDINTAPELAQRLSDVQGLGMDVWAQNGYWAYGEALDFLSISPSDFPVIISEWGGAEGSKNGPITAPGGVAFPSHGDVGNDGIFTEDEQAQLLLDAAFPWIQAFDTAGDTWPITGFVYWAWQDVEWTAFPVFYPGHGPILHSGVVYDNRELKLSYLWLQLVHTLFP